MGFETVPWMVGGGGVHSAEVGRLLAYAAFGGQEGVIGANDLKVTQLGTPGASVNVAIGAVAIPCRAASQLYQSYAGRMVSQDTVGVAGTTSTVRYDLVVAQVEDPWLAGEPWADPAVGQEGVGPYIFARVITGVAQSVIASNEAARAYLASIGRSAIPLAGISQPINNTAIITSQITDLRRVAQPKRQRNVYTINPGSVANLTSASLVDWFFSQQVFVPSWATRAIITATLGGVRIDRSTTTVNGTAIGTIRALLGATATQEVAYDVFAPFADAVARHVLALGDTVVIPSNIQGTTQTLKLQGKKTSGNKNIYVDASSFATVDVEFQEVAG